MAAWCHVPNGPGHEPDVGDSLVVYPAGPGALLSLKPRGPVVPCKAIVHPEDLQLWTAFSGLILLCFYAGVAFLFKLFRAGFQPTLLARWQLQVPRTGTYRLCFCVKDAVEH